MEIFSLENLLLAAVAVFVLLLGLTAFAHIFFFVPFVPTPKRVVEKMIQAARLKPREKVFDLGCGDGRLLFAAEKKTRAPATGFEIAPLVYLLALARKILAGSKAKIYLKNFLTANLRQADVIFCYLIPCVMPSLAQKIMNECKRGTRVVSNTFHIPGLTPHKILPKNPQRKIPTIYVYRI